MTRPKPAAEAPTPAPLPLPGEGGAWLRLPDGRLVRDAEAPVQSPVEPPVKEA
ncbi:MAG: hypothetical protein KF887_07120 [Paracoccaceae bacterium]|nr:MAG: hypothetical protein KF887_07120 [Paracoccaceae bacterium]